MSLLDRWIVHCSDPLGARTPAPRRALPPEQGHDLIDMSEAHGVLGAVMQNFRAFHDDSAFAETHAAARARHRANAAFALLLSREADALAEDLKGLPAAIVKGPVFARRLYPSASLRTFSDIDVLASEEALPRIREVLADRGFDLAEDGKREMKWLHRRNDHVMVEVQTDLIHPDTLHDIVALPYRAIAEDPHGPAALLLTAVVHGGAHQFERLQHVVDICLAARALPEGIEQEAFLAMVNAVNARYLAYGGLMLAARLFDEPRCRALADALGHVRFHLAARLLLDRATVMSSTDRRRSFHNWRRQDFRILIRWNAGRWF
jgi:Uncharacterised nucleotidyltransferase